MSKNLSLQEALNHLYIQASKSQMTKECYNIVETKLKELKDIQDVLDDFKIYNLYNLIDTLKNIKTLELFNKNNQDKLEAFDTIKDHFKEIGGIRGNLEDKKPSNEIVIALKDLTSEEFDSLEEKLK